MKTFPIYRSKNYYRNEKTYRDKGQVLCICCNKPISGKDLKYIHATTDWVATDQEEVENSQGYFAIGSDCAKKFPKEFIF